MSHSGLDYTFSFFSIPINDFDQTICKEELFKYLNICFSTIELTNCTTHLFLSTKYSIDIIEINIFDHLFFSPSHPA